VKTNYKRLPALHGWMSKYNGWQEEPSRHAGKYRHRYAWYFRYIQTFNEKRQLHACVMDGLPVRRARLTVPDVRDDIMVARNYGRSWKDYTKQRHQWGG
jgi:hypothetical protein